VQKAFTLTDDNIFWINPAGGAWETPSNWSLGRVPNASDAVRIQVAGTPTITINSGVAVTRLKAEETLRIIGGSLAVGLTSRVDGGLLIDGGSVGATGVLTVNGGRWWGGTINGSGGVLNTGAFQVQPPANVSLSLSGVLNNSGTVTQITNTSSFPLTMNAGTINNLAGGVWDMQSGLINANGNGGVFNNQGTLRKNASGSTPLLAVPFNNNGGAIDIRAGTLNIVSDSSYTGGTATVAAGAVWALIGGVQTFSAGFSASGAGTVSVTTTMTSPAGQNATFAMAAPGGLRLEGGVSYGGAGELINTGVAYWTQGIIAGAGGIRNTGQMTVQAPPNASLFMSGVLNNSGTVTQITNASSFPLTFSGGTINNLAGGVWDMQSGLTNANGNGGTFNNQGTLLKSTGGPDSSIAANVSLQGGRIQVDAGNLILSGGGASTGGTFAIAAGGATLQLGGTHTWSGAYTGTGSGTLRVVGGTTTLSGSGSTITSSTSVQTTAGSFQTAAGTTATFSGGGLIDGGTMGGTGALSVNGGRWWGGTINGAGGVLNTGAFQVQAPTNVSLSLSGVLNNSGTVTQITNASSFPLTMNAGTINNLAGGVWDMQSGLINANGNGGVFNNQGTLRKNASGSTPLLAVPFNNNGGAIDIRSGTLNIVSDGSYTGGTATVAAGAVWSLIGGVHTFSAGFSASGAGTVSVTTTITSPAGQNATFNMASPGGLRLEGAVSYGGAGELINAGVAYWTQGTIAGAGGIRNTGQMTVQAPPSAVLLLSGTLNNNGTVTQITNTNNQPLTFNGGTINNRGVWDMQSGLINANGNGGLFNNQSFFRKTTGTAASVMSAPFANNTDGQIYVFAGTLSMTANNSYVGGLAQVRAGAVWALSGGVQTFSAGFFAVGAGTVSVTTTITAPAGQSAEFFMGSGSSGGLRLEGGVSYGGVGELINRGVAYWTRGTITGTGGFRNTGQLTVQAPGDTSLSLSLGVLNNSGTVTQITNTNNQPLTFNFGTVNNLAGGVWDVQSGLTNMTGNGGAFNNQGTLLKSTGDVDSTMAISVNLQGGRIQVDAGNLVLSAGGTSTGGTFAIAGVGGATLQLGGTHTWNGAYTGTGIGNLRVAGGTTTLSGSGSTITSSTSVQTTAGSFQTSTGTTATFSFGGYIDGGTMGGTGTLSVNGGRWSDGTINGTGGVLNTGAFVVQAPSNAVLFLSGTLNNSGMVTQVTNTNNQALTMNAGTINNLAGGVWDMQSGLINANGNGGTFNNQGTLRKNASTSTPTIAVPFNNNGGAIDVRSGTLNMTANNSYVGGTATVAAGSVWALSAGIQTFSAGFNASGAGTVSVTTTITSPAGQNVTFTMASPGGLRLDGDVSYGGDGELINAGVAYWTRGTIAGARGIRNTGQMTVQAPPSASLLVSGVLTNSGTVTQITNANNQPLTFNGGAINNLAGGVWDMQSGLINANGNGGFFVNWGSLIKSIGVAGSSLLSSFVNNANAIIDVKTGSLTVSAFTNQGTVELEPGSKLVVSGNFANSATGVLQFDVAGSAGTDRGNFIVSGTANLNGTLRMNFINGYAPAAGTQFTNLMTFAARAGTFSLNDSLNLPAGRSLLARYNSTNFTMEIL
jgi:hypothetical protein